MITANLGGFSLRDNIYKERAMSVRLFCFAIVLTLACGAQNPRVDFTTEEAKNSGTPETAEFYGGKDYLNGKFITSKIPYAGIKIRCDYFGVLEGDVGSCGAVKSYKPASWVNFSFGGGVIFGRGENVGPAAIASIETEKHLRHKIKLTAEASVVQAFRFSGERQRDRYFQSSVGFEKGRSWIGGCTEFLHHREEREWSGGPCAKYALGKTGLFVGSSLFFNGSAVPTPVFGLGFKTSLRE
jgi:hypothetical protein